MRLRQVALVARDLEASAAELASAFEIEVAFRDPGVAVFGLRNAVLPVGDEFLEVVSPAREDTSAGRWLARRGGDGGYMVIVQVRDLARERARVEALGARVVWETALADAATLHLHPRDVGGAILSLDAMVPPDSWRWAGPVWRDHVRTKAVKALAGVELESSDPRALARRWGEILARPPKEAAGGRFEIALEPGLLRFAPERGRGEGLAGVLLAASDRRRAGERRELCGVRFELV
jgi:hypothetical protein